MDDQFLESNFMNPAILKNKGRKEFCEFALRVLNLPSDAFDGMQKLIYVARAFAYLYDGVPFPEKDEDDMLDIAFVITKDIIDRGRTKRHAKILSKLNP